MSALFPKPSYVFNHDGFGILSDLADTAMTEEDAAALLVWPLAEVGITAIDWAVLTTGQHNCRTRHGRGFTGDGQGREIDALVGKVVQHYNAQPLDLLDIVVKHGHERGLRVFGCLRLNHSALNASHMATLPGRDFGNKKDFRDPAFHAYLLEVFEDLLAKGVDGVTLDFERKAPFFPDDAPQEERFQACTDFARKMRRLTDKPLIARVAYDEDKGTPQGQNPMAWLAEGLLDAIVPATHNHEPDPLDWTFDRFLAAARTSPRPCAVWPQIWPTAQPWNNFQNERSPYSAIIKRAEEITAMGADGVYFFNFCCYWPRSVETGEDRAMFGILTGKDRTRV